MLIIFLLEISGSPPGLRRQRHASWASPPDAHPMVDDARVHQNPMFYPMKIGDLPWFIGSIRTIIWFYSDLTSWHGSHGLNRGYEMYPFLMCHCKSEQ